MSYYKQLEKRCEELEEQLIVAKQNEDKEINDLFIRYLAVTIKAAINFKNNLNTDEERRAFIFKKIKLIKVLQDESRKFDTDDLEKMIKEEMRSQHIIP